MKHILLGLALVAVTGCSSNNSSNGAGGAAGSSTGGSSSGGTSSGGSGNAAGSGGVNTGGSGGTTLLGCASLCAHTDSATSSEVDCVASESILRGYDWPSDPVCSTIANEGQCNTCTVNLAMTDADCADVESSCFGGGSGGSGGGDTGGVGGIGGFGGVGGGNTGGSGGSSNLTCAQFCQHAPSATSAEEQCVELQSYLMGYDWSTQPVCQAANTVPGCNACVAALGMPNSACASLDAQCF